MFLSCSPAHPIGRGWAWAWLPLGRDMPVIWLGSPGPAEHSRALHSLPCPPPGGARIEDSRGMRRGLLQAASCIWGREADEVIHTAFHAPSRASLIYPFSGAKPCDLKRIPWTEGLCTVPSLRAERWGYRYPRRAPQPGLPEARPPGRLRSFPRFPEVAQPAGPVTRTANIFYFAS